MREVTEVAVGVLIDKEGRFLMASRPQGKPYAGWWEFPGGKLEAGEAVTEALSREYAEELGVKVKKATPWFVFEREYPHAYVRLHFCRIVDWEGQPQPREGQTFQLFETLKQAQTEKLLPMCSLVIERLMLSDRVALVKTPLSPTVETDFEKSGAKAILASSFTPEKEALAKRLGVPLIVCRQWFEQPEDVTAVDLQEWLVGALQPTADAETILKAASQRLPLYVAACETEEQNERLMQLGAQGVYVAI